MPKKVHFGDFLKTWSLRQKLVGNVKIQISNATILVIFKHCVFAIKFHFLQCQFRILAPFRYDFYTFWSFWSQEIWHARLPHFLQKSTKERKWCNSHQHSVWKFQKVSFSILRAKRASLVLSRFLARKFKWDNLHHFSPPNRWLIKSVSKASWEKKFLNVWLFHFSNLSK